MNKRIARLVGLLVMAGVGIWLSACGASRDSTIPTDVPVTIQGNTAVRTLPPPAVAAIASSTPRPTVGPFASPTPRPTATSQPTLIPTETAPTAEPTAVQPTATVVPPAPTVVVPTATPEPLYAAWLGYLNRFREMSGVAPLGEQAALNLGSRLHSQYMVVNDPNTFHDQNPNLPFYDPAGAKAAENGNVFVTSMIEADYEWGINFWVSAPFHLVPMIAPRLGSVGYGDYSESGPGYNMAAVLDVRSERNVGVGDVTYPLFFPKDGSTTWIGVHKLFEYPDPLSSCPGYSRPAGAPIVVQLGSGILTPKVGTTTLLMGDTPVEICVFDETNYHSPNAWEEKGGRLILNAQDAVVIMPRQPLIADKTYTVQMEANGIRYQWSFRTAASRPAQ